MPQLHATAVSIDGDAVLLSGPSGSGKSDLAFRLIDRGAVLVADDRCDVRAEAGVLYAAPPAALAGMIEVRGVGILICPHETGTPVRLICEMTARGEISRLPEPETVDIDGVSLPLYRLDPFETSAPVKVSAALNIERGRTSIAT